MRGGDGDDHARLAERDRPDPVLGGGGLEAVSLEALGEDRRDPLARHLRVGLVLEAVDVAGDALEGDDRAGAGADDQRRDRVERERLRGDRGVDVGGAAADRRDQRELVAGVKLGARRRRTRG